MTPDFVAPFMPCVEIGWRISAPYWRQGYATEAAKMVLHLAFEKYGLQEVVSFTAAVNLPSIRVMEKIGLTRKVEDDFDHPNMPKDHPLARHVLYRLAAKTVRQRDAVLMEAYDLKWPMQAAEEIAKLKAMLNFPWLVDIQHVGSTAIPNLAAKPILDLTIGVTNLEEIQGLIAILLNEDYIFWEDNPDKSKLFFVKGMPPFAKQRTHHIHVMPISHPEWLLRPLFRDYLITHPEARQAYADLKHKLAALYQYDREAYTEAKTAFVRAILLKAEKLWPHLMVPTSIKTVLA